MSTPVPDPGSPLEAVLLELAGLREKITRLEIAHNDDKALIADLTVTLQRVTGHRRGGKKDAEDEGYQPVPVPRWWQLQGRERAAAVARLRAWAETVFRPGYGHLAGQVGPCWEQHDLCLYLLAWLSELHTAIFLAPERALAAEADWHLRLLPGAVALMAEETGRCDHLSPAPGDLTGADPWASTS
jgi:hypothetical protein